MASTGHVLFALVLGVVGLVALVLCVVQWASRDGDREIVLMTGGLGGFFVLLAVALGGSWSDG